MEGRRQVRAHGWDGRGKLWVLTCLGHLPAVWIGQSPEELSEPDLYPLKLNVFFLFSHRALEGMKCTNKAANMQWQKFHNRSTQTNLLNNKSSIYHGINAGSKENRLRQVDHGVKKSRPW